MNFVDRLKEVKYATNNQRKKEMWDVEGILHNQKFKFDLRPIRNNCKTGSFKTKADKIVFDIDNKFIIVDTAELHEYLKESQKKQMKIVDLNDLISKLEWNIILT